MPRRSLTQHRFTAFGAGLAIFSALTLSACGSDDTPASGDDPDTTQVPETTPAPADQSPSDAPDDSSGDAPEIEPAPGDDTPTSDARFGLTLQAAAEGIVEEFDVIDSFAIDGTTLTYYLNEGDAEGIDPTIDCIGYGAIMDDSETLILAYPNGEVECS